MATRKSTYFSSTQPLRSLSAEQLEAYHCDGFVVVPNVYSANDLKAIDEEITRVGKELGVDADAPHIMSLGLRSQLTEEFCEDERLLTLVQDIVKPGIAIYSAKLIEKPPQSQNICHWHQDDAYYTMNSESDCRMSIWMPLRDATPENGCLQVVPGSHKWGLQNAERQPDGFCQMAFKYGADPLENSVICPVPAGSVLLFSALLWHSSRGNLTDARRRAFIVSYQEATCPRGNARQHRIIRPAA